MTKSQTEWETSAIAIGPGLIARGRKEYLVVDRPYIINRERQDEDVTRWLNEMAADRWRVIKIESFIYFFERELMER